MTGLAHEIAAFKAQLPEIRRRHGAAWTVMSDGRVHAAFPDFGQAAIYAREHLPGREPLIRHTDDPVETLPFLVAET